MVSSDVLRAKTDFEEWQRSVLKIKILSVVLSAWTNFRITFPMDTITAWIALKTGTHTETKRQVALSAEIPSHPDLFSTRTPACLQTWWRGLKTQDFGILHLRIFMALDLRIVKSLPHKKQTI